MESDVRGDTQSARTDAVTGGAKVAQQTPVDKEPSTYDELYAYALSRGWLGKGAHDFASIPDADPPEGYTRLEWRGARAAVMALEPDEPPAPSPWPDGPVLYFIECAGTKAIKIGITRNLRSRLQSIYTILPYGISRAWYRQDGDRHLERELHNTLADYRLSGEWFEPAEPVMAFTSASTVKALPAVALHLMQVTGRNV